MSECYLRPMTRRDLPAILEMERTILDEPVTMATMERELENPLALYLVGCPDPPPGRRPRPPHLHRMR